MPKFTLNTIFSMVANDVQLTVKNIMIQNGIKSNSDIVNSVELKGNNKNLLLYTNSYLKFIQSGRKKFSSKIPISYLIGFIKKNNITPNNGMSINNLAFIIQTAIFKNGILGKGDITGKIENVTPEIISKRIEQLFDVEVLNNEINLILK